MDAEGRGKTLITTKNQTDFLSADFADDADYGGIQISWSKSSREFKKMTDYGTKITMCRSLLLGDFARDFERVLCIELRWKS